MLKHATHNPPHLFLDDVPYFISAATYLKRHLLQAPAIKERLLELLQDYFQRNEWELYHWVILDNHYHLIGKSRQGKRMPAIFRNVHNMTAKEILAVTGCTKPVWWNYWDYCPRNEAEYFTRLNYVLFNPVKHGYVTDLHSYRYSSFHSLYEQMGRAELAKQFRLYPDYKTLVLHEAQEDNF